MTKIQAKQLALTALKVSAAILLFTAKAFLYTCLALYAVGELLFSEYQSATVEEAQPTAETAAIVEQSTPAKAPVRIAAKAVAAPTKSVRVESGPFGHLSAIELRKMCQNSEIKWRNAHGAGKHLSKAEMIAELTA